MIAFFIGCVQLLLLFRMRWFDVFSNFFFYGILFLMLFILVVSYSKKINSLFISTAIVMIAFMAVRLSLSHIENYYFQKTISKGVIFKTDLETYKKKHQKFPESLKDIYKESNPPQYNIGLLQYNFMYHKTDTSYRLYFNHFHGSMFINYGESNGLNFYD